MLHGWDGVLGVVLIFLLPPNTANLETLFQAASHHTPKDKFTFWWHYNLNHKKSPNHWQSTFNLQVIQPNSVQELTEGCS
uniref:Secreted protein n=1 Tax=Esox lucius TaxID=8010 RepID=A0AAY5JYV4_ESOLU